MPIDEKHGEPCDDDDDDDDAATTVVSSTPPSPVDEDQDVPPTKSDATLDEPQSPSQVSQAHDYPTGIVLVLILASLFVGMFLVALDRLIITTAVPQITNEFDSAGDVAWYGTAYLLTNCAFQLVFGKLYTIYGVKSTFMVSVALFELGSALCGAAPTSVVFIIGRAVAGVGSGGIMSGCIVIIVNAVPLHRRPKYQGLFGGVFGLASVLGPLVGGAFTTNITWRWCFYVNLPIGGVVMVLIFFLLNIKQQRLENVTFAQGLKRLNVGGMIALVSGVTCLCLALQWGGSICAWNSGRIIALLVVAFACVIAFALLQVLQPEHAILPPSVFSQRSIASGFWTMSCFGSHQMIFVYFLPIWCQAIRRDSAIQSGIDILPLVMMMTLATIANGVFVSRIGYYTPSMLAGICLSAVGAGLLTTLQVDVSMARLAGFQMMYGFGLGLAWQGPNMAAQTVLPDDKVSIGASLMIFGQQLFGAIFLAVAQNLLENQLSKRLTVFPEITPELIQNTGASELLRHLPPETRHLGLEAYNESLRVCFRLATTLACISITGALAMEWLSVKKKKKSVPPEKSFGEKKAEEAATVSDSQEIGGARTIVETKTECEKTMAV